MQIVLKYSRFASIGVVIFLALVLTQQTARAQQGVVKFLVDNDNGYFEVLLDDTLLVKRYKDTLSAGPHKAQIWSYGYETKEVTFTVTADTTTDVFVKLDRSAAYLAYEQSYQNYRHKFHKAVTLPISLTLAMGVTSGVFMLKGYDLKKQLTTDISSYHMTPQPDEIAALKESIEHNNRRYTLYRYGYYVTGSLTLVGIATSIYTGLKFKHNHTEPTYSKSSPFDTRSSFYVVPGGFYFSYRIG